MGIRTTLEMVTSTEDGPYPCWDTVVTAAEVARLWETGFLRIDPERQRGKDSVTGREIIDQDKVDKWAEQLVSGDAILGQLSWNFRTETSKVEYDEAKMQLIVEYGYATLPDSGSRHRAIIKAVKSAERGSKFSTGRKFSVRIYHAPAAGENRIFFAMNEEGRKADPSRSKWLHRQGIDRLAGAFVESCPHLGVANVDTVRDRLSKRNPRLCAFNTLSRAFEEHLADLGPDTFDADLGFLIKFWEQLVRVRPELKPLPIGQRQKIREGSLVDSALAIHAYIGLAKGIKRDGTNLNVLNKDRKSVV